MLAKTRSDSAGEHSRRHRILAAARDRMIERGYAATTVDDICKAAGVTKGAFFHHFDSKEAMAREVLERFIESLAGPMSFARDPRAEADPLKRVRSMLERIASVYENKHSRAGCLIGMFAMELGALNSEFGSLCAGAYHTIQEGIERELAAAVVFHSARELDTRQLAETAVAAIQGAIILARAQNDPGRIRLIIDSYVKLLERTISG